MRVAKKIYLSLSIVVILFLQIYNFQDPIRLNNQNITYKNAMKSFSENDRFKELKAFNENVCLTDKGTIHSFDRKKLELMVVNNSEDIVAEYDLFSCRDMSSFSSSGRTYSDSAIYHLQLFVASVLGAVTLYFLIFAIRYLVKRWVTWLLS